MEFRGEEEEELSEPLTEGTTDTYPLLWAPGHQERLQQSVVARPEADSLGWK